MSKLPATMTSSQLGPQRKNPIATLAAADAQKYMSLLESQYGREWLGMSVDHPLRVLWQRDDAISTMELLTFGHAIDTMLEVAPAWAARQVKLSKSDNQSQRKGALFEIIGLAAFASAGHRVIPAADSSPAYDGLVQAQESGRMYRVSLKHHGLSSHELGFREACQSLEADFVAQARAAKRTAVRALITGRLPWEHSASVQLADFFRSEALLAALSGVLVEEGLDPPPPPVEIGPLSVYLFTFPSAGLASHQISYVVQVLVPQHKNEYKNLEDKLNDACIGFLRHSKDGSVPGLVMLRLPATANVEGLTAWIRDYLQQATRESLDVVFLYQPSVRRDSEIGSVALTIYVDEVESPRCRIAGNDRRTRFFIGRLLSTPYHNWFGFENIDDKYCYQSGHIFADASGGKELKLLLVNAGRTAWASSRTGTPAPGLHFHELSVGVDGNDDLDSPDISPDDQLLIL